MPSTRTRTRRFRPDRARQAWDEAIDVWEDFQESGKDYHRDRVHGPALLTAVGRVEGLAILDLGCGQGRFARQLAERGGVVTGVDWSRAMITAARARERTTPLGIEYRVLDARTLARHFPDERFDLVVACMSLMDMPDLPRVVRGAHRVLRPGGRFVFSVSHPFNTSTLGWEHPKRKDRGAMRFNDYYSEGPRVLHWGMPRLKRPFSTPYWHRTLESWFSTLGRAGFLIESLIEPRASSRDARAIRQLAGTRKVPFYLVLSCRKLPDARGKSVRMR